MYFISMSLVVNGVLIAVPSILERVTKLLLILIKPNKRTPDSITMHGKSIASFGIKLIGKGLFSEKMLIKFEVPLIEEIVSGGI